MDICHMGASFISRSYFLGILPHFFRGQKPISMEKSSYMRVWLKVNFDELNDML